MNLCPSHPSLWNYLHQKLKFSLIYGWSNHMFSNLKISPHLNGLESKTIRQWPKENFLVALREALLKPIWI